MTLRVANCGREADLIWGHDARMNPQTSVVLPQSPCLRIPRIPGKGQERSDGLSVLSTRFHKYANVLTGDLPVAPTATPDGIDATIRPGMGYCIYEIGY